MSYNSMLNVMLLTGCLAGPDTILGSVSEVSWFFLYVQLNWKRIRQSQHKCHRGSDVRFHC